MKKIPTSVLYDAIRKIENGERVNIATFEFVDLLKEVCELRTLVQKQANLLNAQSYYIDKFIDRG